MDYLATYIQRATDPEIDIKECWGIIVKTTPTVIYPEIKDYVTHDWPEINGVEIYIPPIPKYKSYDIVWNFSYIGDRGTSNSNITCFLDYLQGHELSIFSCYIQNGYRVVYKKCDPKSFKRREEDIVDFDVTFMVTKPKSYGIYLNNIPQRIKALKDEDIFWSDGEKMTLKKGEEIIVQDKNWGIITIN